MGGDGGLFREATWHPLGHLLPDLPLNEQNIVENAIHNPAAAKETVNDRPLAFVSYGLDPRLRACRQKVSDHPRLEYLGRDELSEKIVLRPCRFDWKDPFAALQRTWSHKKSHLE